MYVYIKSEASLWTVGFYDPDGKWQPESDHSLANNAAHRVAFLNGASRPYPILIAQRDELLAMLHNLRDSIISHQIPHECAGFDCAICTPAEALADSEKLIDHIEAKNAKP